MWPPQHHLTAAVEGRFGGVDLGENVLAGYVLGHHPVDGLHLSDDLFQPAVQVIGVHTLFCVQSSIPLGVTILSSL